MADSNKILAGIVLSVLAVCVTIVCIVNVSRKDEIATTLQQGTTVSQTFSQQDTSETQTTTTAASTTHSATESAVVTTHASTSADTADIRSQLIGKWSDSAGMSGYEFFPDGSVKMTYVNLAAFGVPLDGKADGVYILEGNTLTIKFSIYTATIENTYTVSFDGKILSMYNTKEHETSTYTRVDATAETTTASAPSTTAESTPEGIVDTWVNADGTLTYTFEETGMLTAVICNADGSSCTTNEGIYLTQENSLVLQYSNQGANVTKSYTWSIADNVLTLTDENGAVISFTRQTPSESGQAVSSAEALIGKWSDSAQMSGYEFLGDGTVNVKYVDFTVPVLNIPVKTSVPGAYTVNGDEVTVTHSIYGATISNTYRFSVRDNVLTLINTEDGNTSTYIKKD